MRKCNLLLSIIIFLVWGWSWCFADEPQGWFVEQMQKVSDRIKPPNVHDRHGQIQAHVDWGDALIVTHEYEKAIEQYKAALALQQKDFRNLAGGDIVPLLIFRISILTRIGNAFLDAGQNRQARAILQQALSMASWGISGDEPVLRDLRTAHSLSLVHTLSLEEAHAFYEKLYASAGNVYADDHALLARILSRWAIVDVSLEQYDAAIERIEKSLAITRRAYGEAHPFVADHKAMLASLLYAHGDASRVAGLLDRVLDIRVAAFGSNHARTQQARQNQRNLQ